MTLPVSPSVMDSLVRATHAAPGLELLFLYGSRARRDGQPSSDWDFGYLATEAIDPAALLATLVEIVGSDRVDLVDLRRASGLLRYRAARDGQLIYEARPGIGDDFRLEAARFWCDAAPVLERGYDEVLAELEP